MIDASTMAMAVSNVGKERAGKIAADLEKRGLKGPALIQAFVRQTLLRPEQPFSGGPPAPPPNAPPGPSGPQPQMPTGQRPPEAPPPAFANVPKGLPPDSAIPPPDPELRGRIEQLARAHPVPPPQAAPRQPQTTPQAEPLRQSQPQPPPRRR